MNEMKGNQKNKNRDKYDFYVTHPSAIYSLIKRENIKNKYVLENSAGNGHLVKPLREFNNNVIAIDVIEREFKLDKVCDFLLLKNYKNISNKKFDCVVMNPPFKHFIEFVKHSFKFSDVVYVFGRIQILEGKKRYYELYDLGILEKVYVFVNRMSCAKSGDESMFFKNNSMVYCWYKFNLKHKGETTLDWIIDPKTPSKTKSWF